MTMSASIACLLATALWSADAPVADSDLQDLVLLNPRGPILVRLHIENETSPYQQAWGDALWSTFERIDTDANQEISFSEFNQFPLNEFIVRDGVTGLDSMQPLSYLDLDNSPRDGAITFEECVAAIGSNCIRFQPELAPSSSAQDSDPAMTLMDQDNDQLLSFEECRSAYTQLMRLDYNDDELLSEGESSNQVDQGQNRFVSSVPGRATMRQRDRVSTIAPVPGTPPASIAKMAQEYYTRIYGKAAPGLRTSLPEKPDLELRIRLGANVSDDKRVEIIDLGKAAFTLSRNEGSRWLFDRQGIRFELVIAKTAKNGTLANLPQQFKQLDADKNDYLDLNEFRRAYGEELFKIVDRDNNNQVYLPELTDYFSSIQSLRQSRIALSIREIGQAIFDIVDVNQNGTLSPREMKNLPTIVSGWDADRDDHVAPAEIPRVYRVWLSTGNEDADNSMRTVSNVQSMLLTVRPPAWFVKMDRNHDGDLTPREFLGKHSNFEKADADRDGLLSSDEAAKISK